MNKITIPKEEMLDILWDGDAVIERTITDTSRWSIHYELIFKYEDGKTYATSYSVGATEMQDESPWEYEDHVECVEVHQVEKTVKVWEAVE